jgi:hypothetical protein
MITEIGIIAGEIWHFLENEIYPVTLKKLVESIDAPNKLLLMSLGWLAREGHVIIYKEKGKYKISLKSK